MLKINLKQAVLLFALFTIGYVSSFAEIPGKIYVVGDSIHMDGMVCLVFKVSEDGTHGTAVSPKGKLSGIEKMAIKMNLKNKKGLHMSSAAADSLIKECEYSCIPNMPIEKDSKSKTEHFDYAKWREMVPKGWDLMSLEQMNELLETVKPYENLTYKKMKDYNMTEQAYNFFIQFVTLNEDNAKFGIFGKRAGNLTLFRLYGKKLEEFSAYNKYIKTFAVKNF